MIIERKLRNGLDWFGFGFKNLFRRRNRSKPKMLNASRNTGRRLYKPHIRSLTPIPSVTKCMHILNPSIALHYTSHSPQRFYSSFNGQQLHHNSSDCERDSWDYDTCLSHAKMMYEKHVLHDDKDGFVDWERECQMLLAKVLGLCDYSVSAFYAHMRRPASKLPALNLTTEQQQHYCRLVRERYEQRRPLDYVLQTSSFYAHTFEVNEHVLIPRSDSERLVDTALDIIHREHNAPHRIESDMSILDIGTGSGCLILSGMLRMSTQTVHFPV